MSDSHHEPIRPLEMTKGFAGILRNSAEFIARLFDLIAIEARLAGFSLAMIIAAGIGIVLLVMSAWLLLMSAVAYSMISAGYGWGAALLLLAVVNLIAVMPLVYMIVRLSRNLLFIFTRKQAKNLNIVGDEQYATHQTEAN